MFKINDTITAKSHPEWGAWTVIEDNGEWLTIRGGSGVRVLFYDEAAQFWAAA